MKRYLFYFLVVILGSACLLRADETIRALQERLKTGGFYYGEINGVYDSQTAAGVTRYQIRNGLQITGKLDEQTRYALGLSAAAPKAPLPRFGEDVWRYLRKSDQARISRMIAEDEKKRTAAPKPAANAPAPPATQTRHDSPQAAAENDRLKDYIGAFVLAGLDPRVGAETEFFADRVDYFGEHGVPREKIRHDLQRYNERWPQRSFRLAGDLDVTAMNDRLRVTFPLRYDLRNGSRHSTGTVLKTLVLEKSGQNDLQIVSVNERKAR
jgi:peptidoglycan hydrolase-like protein with peptidoglycan-binding domain